MSESEFFGFGGKASDDDRARTARRRQEARRIAALPAHEREAAITEAAESLRILRSAFAHLVQEEIAKMDEQRARREGHSSSTAGAAPNVDWLKDADLMSALRHAASNDDADAKARLREAGIGDDIVDRIKSAAEVVALADMNPGPRPWVMPPWLCLGFLTILAAPGGKGKTAVLYLIALAVLVGEEHIAGMEVRRPGSVLLLVQEDDKAEFERRMKAAARLHKQVDGSEITDAAFCGRRLLVRVAPFKVATAGMVRDEDGNPRIDVIVNWPEVVALVALCKLHNVTLVGVDPLSHIHDLEENSRYDMQAVANALIFIAQQAGVAVLALHHTKKGSVTDGNAADAVRGSTALVNKARTVLTVTSMKKEEAPGLGAEGEEVWRSLIRVDSDAKANMVPAQKAKWFRLHSVDLNNARHGDPADHVGAAKPWVPQPPKGLTASQKLEALRFIDAGAPNGERWSRHRQSRARFVVSALSDRLGVAEHVVFAALQEWERAGVVREETYERPNGNNAKGLVVDPAALSAAGAVAERDDESDEIPS